MSDRDLALFTLDSGRDYGEKVAAALGVELAEHEERSFEWGQHKTRTLESVRGRDVYVVQSLHGDPDLSANDKLCRLLFFIGSLVDAAAARVTAVVPFLCYTRKEQKTKPRDPVITRYVAGLFESVGTDRVVTLEVHNLAAFQNAFRCQTEHLEADELFADYFVDQLGDRPITVVSPDVGGVKRAARYRAAIEQRVGHPLPHAYVEKFRSEDVVTGDVLVGDVEGRHVILFDDMICAGTTLARAAATCLRAGAESVRAAAAHGAFTPAASQTLREAPLEQIVVLDHIPPFALEPSIIGSKLVVLDGARLVANAIRHLHAGG